MPTSRSIPTVVGIAKKPVVDPDIANNLANVKSITSTDVLEVWADNGIWDTTTNAPVSIDKFNITGTPRKRT